MSTESSPSPEIEPSAAPAAAAPAKPLAVMLAVVAGLAVGAGAGTFAVGPALAGPAAPVAAHGKRHAARHSDADDPEDAAVDENTADPDDGDGDAASKEHGSGGKEGAESSVYTIDNLVLNPAQSGGTRFLLLTVAFEMKNAASLEQMKARDAELRDAILVTLGSKTVEQLSDMTARDSLKIELRTAAAKLMRVRGVRRIYFPQFVIQ